MTTMSAAHPSPEAEHLDWWLPKTKLPYDDKTWKAVVALLQRAYFGRLWVIQEIQVGNLRTVLQCGRDEAPWRTIRLAVRLIYAKSSFIPGDLRDALVPLDRISADLTRLTFPAIIQGSVHNAKCTNNKDKVYGFLGLATDAFHARVPVDYDASTEAIYASLVVAHMEHVQRLEFLPFCDPERDMTHLPS